MKKNGLLAVSIMSVCLGSAALLLADTRKVTKRVAPVYPALAAKMRIEGTVKLEATVNEEGIVEEVKVVSGHTLLAASAIEAVKQWRYEPGVGKATLTVSVEFALPH